MKGIIVSGSAKTKREIVPSGTMVGRCYSMIEIGTVEWEYQGEKKFTKKVRLSFELPTEMRDFGKEVEQPMTIDKEYTMSLYEKANLRQDLESWRGAAFTNDELKAFDVSVLLGKPAMLSIIHKTSRGGNEFAQIANISALGGFEIADQINESFIFNYEDKFNEEWLDNQPQWLQDNIKGTEEYQNKMNQKKFADTPKDDMPF